MSPETIFIGFGSNLGDRQEFCDRAIALMNLLPQSQVTAISAYYETEPVGPVDQLGSTWFYNGVVRVQTHLAFRMVFDILRETERGLGRDETHRHGARTMDLDLLFFGSHVVDEPELKIPHPRLHLRRFVLLPLAELAPDWIHPALGKSIQVLLDELNDPSDVRKLDLIPGAKYKNRSLCNVPFSP